MRKFTLMSLICCIYVVSSALVKAEELTENTTPSLGVEKPEADVSTIKDEAQYWQAPILIFRLPLHNTSVPVNVSTVTTDNLQVLPVNDLRQALGGVSGVNLLDDIFPGRPVRPTIQGSLPRHVRIMVDDIPLNMHDEGQANPNLLP